MVIARTAAGGEIHVNTVDIGHGPLGHAIRTHGRAPVVLAGHSWGGMLGLRLAAAEPDLIGGLLLTNTPLLRTAGPGRLGFRTQRAMLRAGFPVRVYGRVAARALYGATYRRQHPDVADSTAKILRRLGREAPLPCSAACCSNPTTPSTYSQASSCRCGSWPAWRTMPARRSGRVAAHGHDVVLHPGGHMGPREAPAAVAEALRELIGRVVPDAKPTTDAGNAAGTTPQSHAH